MFELLIIVVILLVVFGAGKVRGAGSDLGAAVKGLRRALQAPRPGPPPAGPPPQDGNHLPDAEFPEVLATRERGSGKPGA